MLRDRSIGRRLARTQNSATFFANGEPLVHKGSRKLGGETQQYLIISYRWGFMLSSFWGVLFPSKHVNQA